MLYVAAYESSSPHLLQGRLGKPFNPMLGETYELVTPNFRYFSEMVSHHPPVSVFNCQGSGFEIHRQMQTSQHFNGKQVRVEDENMGYIIIGPETYEIKNAPLFVGNLVVGERYIEPHGKTFIRCQQTGIEAEVDYKTRRWGDTNTNVVSTVVRDSKGNPRYEINGKYTEALVATDIKEGRSWTIFEAPKKLPNNEKMFNYNIHALQLNLLSDDLAKKLPPTDSRFRPDMRQWEAANLEAANSEKNRLE
jgi:hypothetical protein